MSPLRGQSAVSKFFVSIWACITLILLFCVVLLVRELLDREQRTIELTQKTDELAAAVESSGSRPSAELGKRDVQVYFANADASALAPLSITIPFTDSTVENCRAVLEQIIAGPPESMNAVLPDSTQIRGMYLLADGELVVDLSREVIAFHRQFKSASMEALMAYSIVNSLSQPGLQSRADPEVRTVRILLEGSLAVDAFPAHMDWSAPLAPDARWVQAPLERTANG